MTGITQRILKEVRKAKGYQQEDVAAYLKIPQSTYAYKEKHGGFTTLEKETIAKYLKVDMTHIVWNSTYQTKTGGSDGDKDRVLKNQEERIAFLEAQVVKLTEMLNKALEKR